MARYIGPKTRISRKFSEPLFGADRSFEKKNYPPGQHGQNKRRRKASEYGIQLAEKQKAKYTYGILEKQFRNTFKKAAQKRGVTGEVLLQLIETRLDNVVYRLGIAPTRAAARQLIGHKHIEVNNDIVNIPSFAVRPGDVVSIRERSKSLEAISESLATRTNAYSWLEWDTEKLSGKLLNYPERSDIPRTSTSSSSWSFILSKRNRFLIF